MCLCCLRHALRKPSVATQHLQRIGTCLLLQLRRLRSAGRGPRIKAPLHGTLRAACGDRFPKQLVVAECQPHLGNEPLRAGQITLAGCLRQTRAAAAWHHGQSPANWRYTPHWQFHRRGRDEEPPRLPRAPGVVGRKPDSSTRGAATAPCAQAPLLPHVDRVPSPPGHYRSRRIRLPSPAGRRMEEEAWRAAARAR